jgi:hypothetical protein
LCKIRDPCYILYPILHFGYNIIIESILLIFIVHDDFGTRWRWVVSFTIRPLCLRGNRLCCPLDRWPAGHRADLDIVEYRKIRVNKYMYMKYCQACSKKVGLEINTEITKCMSLSRHQNIGQNLHLKICNRWFENVAQFRYLGTTIII